MESSTGLVGESAICKRVERMIRNCGNCGIEFESEGHVMGDDLSLCGLCNEEHPEMKFLDKD